MRNLLSILFLMAATFSYGQTNFYTMLDSVAIVDSSFYNVPDSKKTGAHKQLERLRTIWGPRLSPGGKVSAASSAIAAHSITFRMELTFSPYLH